jgi:IS5 family transposase
LARSISQAEQGFRDPDWDCREYDPYRHAQENACKSFGTYVDRFGDHLAQARLQARNEQIIDASIVRVPIQRNSRDENRRINAGEVPEDWDEHKRRQKDNDARWTKKHGKSAFGYKNHIDVDAEHRLIRDDETTAANVHDSQVFDDIIDPENADPQVWADSAYRSEATEAALSGAGYESHICEKSQSNQPLSDEQQAANRRRSKARSRRTAGSGNGRFGTPIGRC